MLRLNILDEAVEFILGIDRKHAGQIALKLLLLLKNPNQPDAIQVKGTKTPYFRVSSGEYRIIYRVEGDILHVPIIGKRDGDDVYKEMRRKGL